MDLSSIFTCAVRVAFEAGKQPLLMRSQDGTAGVQVNGKLFDGRDIGLIISQLAEKESAEEGEPDYVAICCWFDRQIREGESKPGCHQIPFCSPSGP